MRERAVLVDDPLFLEHQAPQPHPERPERLTAARSAVRTARAHIEFIELEPRDATDEELIRVHLPKYVAELGQSAGHWGFLDADTYVCPGSVAAARRASGGAIALTEALLRSEAFWGVALLRPPGHHARPGAAMGFCLLNHVAVAAAHARSLGAERVLVLDWDVHHGNGTQEMFYADPSVLYISLHQHPYYPGTGATSETGSAEGRGHTVNVPLSSGAGDAVYRAAFERLITPILEQYRPTLVLVSAGYDAHLRDPLGGMLLTEWSYEAMARAVRRSVGPGCPIGLVLEGGYDLTGLETSLAASFAGLTAGEDSKAARPEPIEARHEEDLQRAAAAQAGFWMLD